MNYKEVLENQIKKLEEVQGKLIQIITGKDVRFTGKTLEVITNTSERIESLVWSLIKFEGKTATNTDSNGQNLITIGSKIENTPEFQEHVQRSLEKMQSHYRKK